MKVKSKAKQLTITPCANGVAIDEDMQMNHVRNPLLFTDSSKLSEFVENYFDQTAKDPKN